MDASGREEAVRTFTGARAGERLLVSEQGVSLEADGRETWHVPHQEIRSVVCVRRVRDDLIHDAVHVCTTGGRDRHFIVATSRVDDDYDSEFSEAVADAVAASLRRAAGLDPVA